MDNLSKIFSHLIEPPLFHIVVGLLVLLILLYLIYKYRRSTQGIVPFKTQGGTIEISPSTLRGVIQHAANSVEGVEKATCHHFIRGRSIGVRIAVHLRANNRLRDVEARIKRFVRATLYEQFGMENIDPIHIRITRIVGDPVAVGENRYADELDESQAALLESDSDGYDEHPYSGDKRT